MLQQQSQWETMRKNIRQLESEVDSKLIAYGRISYPRISETMELELETLLAQVWSSYLRICSLRNDF